MKTIALLIAGTLYVSTTFAQDLYPTFTYHKATDTLIWNAAWDHFNNDRYKDGLKTIFKLKKIYEESAAVHWFKAICLRELNEIDAAFYHIGQAIAFAPGSYGLLAVRSDLWRSKQNYENESADLTAYLVHAPDDEDAVERYVAVLRTLDKTPEAIAFLELRREDDVAFLNNLAHLYASTSRYDSAVSILQHAIMIAPTEEQSYLNLAITYHKSGQSNKALDTADRILLTNPKCATAYAIKSWVYDELGWEDESEMFYEMAEEYGYEWGD